MNKLKKKSSLPLIFYIYILYITDHMQGRAIRGGGEPPGPPTRVTHGGGALLMLHLLAFPFLRQSTFYAPDHMVI